MRPLLLSMFFLLLSCGIHKKSKPAEDVLIPATDILTVVDSSAVDLSKANSHEFVNPDTVKILDTVYSIRFKGAEVFNKRGDKEYWGFPFGSELLVINNDTPLLAVIRDYPSKDNTRIVYYVNKEDTGSEKDLPLPGHYLNMDYDSCLLLHEQNVSESSYWDNNEDYTNAAFDNNYNPDDYKDIEISSISSDEFFKMKDRYKNQFTVNNVVKKVNGVITIGKKQFKDSKENPPYENYYDYIGEYKFLNAYVLQYTCTECEEYSFEAVNKKTGEIIMTTASFPFYSPDGKTILCIDQLFSDSPTALSIYKLPEQESYANKEFGSWIPVGEPFWGNDGYFYTEAIPYVTAILYYNNKDRHDREEYNFRYLKINIKGPTLNDQE